jgi:hypothetical protein
VFATNVVAPVQVSMGPDGTLYVLSFVDGALSRIRYIGGGTESIPVTTVVPAGNIESEPSAGSQPADSQSVTAPAVRILTPEDGSKWPAGAEIALSGEATDAAGNVLVGAGLQWTATLHHNDHVHPDFFHGEGAAETFRFEPHAPNIYYKLCLTATDAQDRAAATCVDVYQSAGEKGADEPATPPAAEDDVGASAAGDTETGAPAVAAASAEATGDKSAINGVQRQRWLDLGGAAVADLTGHSTYPDKPDKVDLLPALETGGDGKDYGERLRGYLTPPADGDYLFWIAADDSGELWLSIDEDPAHAQLIASTTTWTGKRAWDKSPTQASAAIPLKAGQRYYIEARHKQADQKDNLSVAWQLPGGERTLIESAYLMPE